MSLYKRALKLILRFFKLCDYKYKTFLLLKSNYYFGIISYYLFLNCVTVEYLIN